MEEAAVPARTPERIALYRSKVADRKILVLLDNAPGEAAVRSLLPSGTSCAAIVTCHSRMPPIEGAEIVDLGPLGTDQAVELLARLAGESRVAAEPRAAKASPATAEDCRSLSASPEPGWPPGRTGRCPGWPPGFPMSG